ncbi:hypothetical protein ABIB94_006894 [Bradyrhizobium sp. JR7.2]|jgi:hypothetical protein
MFSNARTNSRDETRSSGQALAISSVCARAAAPQRALVNRAALRLGHPASIPRARTAELFAGGTRKRGSPAAIAITAPFPGAAIEPVSSLHSDPRAPSGRYAHALRVPFSIARYAPGARLVGPAAPVAQLNSHEDTMEGGLRHRFRIISSGRRESECRPGFAMTGFRLRERLAVPVAETRDVQTLSSGAHRSGPGKTL